MKFCTAAFLLVVIQACGTTVLRLENLEDSKHTKDLAPDVQAKGSSDSEVARGTICNEMAVAGLNVSLEYELGSRPQAEVVLSNQDHTEILQPGSENFEGWRIQDTKGLRYAYVKTLAGAYERSGSFKVQLKLAGQIVEERAIVIKSGECHVEAQFLIFQVKSTQPLTLKDGMEYFPLDSGAIIERNPKTGVASNLASTQEYPFLEVIREIVEETSNGEAVSIASRLEKPAQGKTLLGQFHERGVDRGALPTGKVNDTGNRWLYSR